MSAVHKAQTVAAVDLGSNSFHLLIARVVDEELQVLDRMREPVCLGAGLDDKNRLTEEVQRTALEALERMGQRIRPLEEDHVRAVGTNALRLARNRRDFLARARQALGYPIEVISGQEEARLIYAGVVRSTFSDAQQLVIDIGGGSTEIILGRAFEVLSAHSLYMGCVSHSLRYVTGSGKLCKEGFRQAEIAARLEMRSIQKHMRSLGWEACLGASGTIQAVRDILRAAGWTDGTITLPALKKLRKVLIQAGDVRELEIPGLKAERAPVFPGGVAILMGIFKSLELEAMTVSGGTLREGLLHDLVGRMRHEDVRDATIRRLAQQYHVDLPHASRVERTALDLLRQVGPPLDSEEARRILSWVARLHEIGLALSHTGFHKHGAYLAANSDLPGFSADDQQVLAALIRYHRRRVDESAFEGLPASRDEMTRRLCVLFRLAVVLNRSRVKEPSPGIHWGEKDRIELLFPAGWKDDHPLTAADLGQESSYLEAMEVKLALHERAAAGTSSA